MRDYQLLIISFTLSLMSITLTKPESMKSIYKEKKTVLSNIYIYSFPNSLSLCVFCKVKHLALHNPRNLYIV